jgi:nucleoside-diphosphate-sugar epimerase
MSSRVLVLGYGAVGQATVKLLQEKGYQVTVAQRSAPQGLPAGVQFIRCDVLDRASVLFCPVSKALTNLSWPLDLSTP